MSVSDLYPWNSKSSWGRLTGRGGTVFTPQSVPGGAVWVPLVRRGDGSMHSLVTERDRRAQVRGVQMVQDRTWRWTLARVPGR